MHLLLLDGYSEAGRKVFQDAGLVTPDERYRRVLMELTNCTVDVVHPADPGSNLARGVEVQQFDGFVITGSSLHSMEYDDVHVKGQLELTRTLLDAGVPGFGSCWGLQVATQALGGGVVRNPRGHEAPFARKISLSPAGRAHPMYHGKTTVFDAPAVHDDIVAALPPGSTVLASNDLTLVQSAHIPWKETYFWGVQYHPEMDLAYALDIIELRREKLVSLGHFASAESLQASVKSGRDLVENPENHALRLQFALDEDILDPAIRQREISNWLSNLT